MRARIFGVLLLAIDKHGHGLSSTRNMGNFVAFLPLRHTSPPPKSQPWPLFHSSATLTTNRELSGELSIVPLFCYLSGAGTVHESNASLESLSGSFSVFSALILQVRTNPQHLLLTYINSYSGQHLLSHYCSTCVRAAARSTERILSKPLER